MVAASVVVAAADGDRRMVTDADITSRANPRVKAWRALRNRSERDRTGRFLVEGERETLRAANHLTVVESIVRIDRFPVDLPAIVTVGPEVFDAISAREHPDGVAAVVESPDHGLPGFVPETPRLVLVADGVEKPGNLGAMIRSADALGASLIASSAKTDLVNPNVVRSAQGSLFGVPLASCDRKEAITWCDRHTDIVVTTPDAARPIWDLDLTGDVSIVIGNEHSGVDDAWRTVGVAASIPMVGVADSLNASVTAGIMLAEAVRQRSA